MKYALICLLGNAVSLASVAAATFLIYHDKTGWGWFIFLAIASLTTFTTRKGDKV